MPTFVHIDWAQAEAENVKFTRLAWTLAIALTIDQLLVIFTLRYDLQARLHTRAIMVDHAFGAHRGAHVALSHNETWWALWEPLFLTLLTILAFLLLSVSTPEGQWLLTALLILLLEELGASEFLTI